MAKSLSSVLSKVFKRLVSVRLRRFMERSGVLPTTRLAYRKGLGACNALLSVSHNLQSALDSGAVARIVQIYFSAIFDRATIRAFSIGSALWVLEVPCCLQTLH